MIEDTTQSTQATVTPNTPARSAVTTFRHHKRPAWGLAVFLWERDGKRGYQFEDGSVRVFKDGFYHLLRPTEAPVDGATTRALERMAARTRVAAEGHLSPRVRAKPMPRVADQIGLFMSQYPEGFGGKAWRTQIRGAGARRPLKRHRDRAVALAKARLAKHVLAEFIELEQWAAVRDAAVEVLRVTDLVTKKEADKFADLPASSSVAWSIYDLLHGGGSHAKHLGAFVHRLSRHNLKPSWNLATALPALLHPEEHVCVKPSVLKLQAKMVKPAFKPKSSPNGKDYGSFLDVTATVHEELTSAGREPADLLDVAQFIWDTLRPSARERLMGAGARIEEVH